jgi:hypothetical protein
MPAPPSKDVKAANQKAMDAAKAKSNSYGGINTGSVKTSPKGSITSFGPTRNNDSSYFGGINTNKVTTNSPGNNGGGLLGGPPKSGFFGGIDTNRVPTDPRSYSDPSRAGALRSLVNGINMTRTTSPQKVDAMLAGLGYTNPMARPAMLGRLSVESDKFAPDVISGKRYGDLDMKDPAYGLAQWRGDREDAAKAYADQMGLPRGDITGQAAFMGNELANSYPESFKQIQEARTIADAMKGMNSYERPRGYTPGGDPRRVEGYGESMARAQSFAATPPTQTASLTPAAAPPAPQRAIPQAETGPSMWEQYAPDMLQKAVTTIDENLVQPTREQVEKYGGFERAGRLARVAVSVMNFLPGGTGGLGGKGNGGNPNNSTGFLPPQLAQKPKPRVNQPINPVTPTSLPPAMYPQYTQSWANLPTGRVFG